MARTKATRPKNTPQKKTETSGKSKRSPSRKKTTVAAGKKATPTGKKASGAKKKTVLWSTAMKEKPEFPIVDIGASAGGLQAFEEFFAEMPADSGMAFVLVAHLDPTHVSILPELVQKTAKMAVHQIRDGMRVQPNTVYVIPPNKHLTILNGVLQLMEPSQPRGASLPIDSFFRSLAKDQRANAICIVLSGTGTDGTLGLKTIKGEGGIAMVQDENSAKYDGMPRSAISTNLADYVLPPAKMPGQLIKYMKYAVRIPAPRVVPTEGKTADALKRAFVILRTRTDHDCRRHIPPIRQSVKADTKECRVRLWPALPMRRETGPWKRTRLDSNVSCESGLKPG
ncbi:MAG: chemotaxis protein CheB [bacterium]